MSANITINRVWYGFLLLGFSASPIANANAQFPIKAVTYLGITWVVVKIIFWAVFALGVTIWALIHIVGGILAVLAHVGRRTRHDRHQIPLGLSEKETG